jgi:hypothetical protein
MMKTISSEAGSNTRTFNDYPEMEYINKLMVGGSAILHLIRWMKI